MTNRKGGTPAGRDSDGVPHPSWNLDRYFTLPASPDLNYAWISSAVHMLVLSLFFYLGVFWALDRFGFKSTEFIVVYLALRAVQIALFSRDTIPTPDVITFSVIHCFNCYWQRSGNSWAWKGILWVIHGGMQIVGAFLAYGFFRGSLAGRIKELPSYGDTGDSRVVMFILFGFFFQVYYFAKMYVQHQANDYILKHLGMARSSAKTRAGYHSEDGEAYEAMPDDHRRNAVKATDFALVYFFGSIVVLPLMLAGFVPDYFFSFVLYVDQGSASGARVGWQLTMPLLGGLLALVVISLNTWLRKRERGFTDGLGAEDMDGADRATDYPDDEFLIEHGYNKELKDINKRRPARSPFTLQG